ncbi:hypothetical protein UCREL1_2768 [Eutypa lata UCREL1]|uniref:Uncharacterized protein n=1 Tax=Eutypa lata (strain UCR-EL1) TaxID=1287681 RepID=M7TJU6_EUTLA|nr:hypothetical protein UCREL1_2768 [Eutypa lata UCREL1]
MDADLRGVGFISGTPTKETFTATLPSHSQRRPSQSPETNMAANMDDSDVMLDGSGMSRTSQIENCDESMGYQDDIVLESHKSSPRSYSPNLSTTGKMFPESPTYGSPSLEDISGNSEESEDDDLDLEKSADEALSLWMKGTIKLMTITPRKVKTVKKIRIWQRGKTRISQEHLLNPPIQVAEDNLAEKIEKWDTQIEFVVKPTY